MTLLIMYSNGKHFMASWIHPWPCIEITCEPNKVQIRDRHNDRSFLRCSVAPIPPSCCSEPYHDSFPLTVISRLTVHDQSLRVPSPPSTYYYSLLQFYLSCSTCESPQKWPLIHSFMNLYLAFINYLPYSLCSTIRTRHLVRLLDSTSEQQHEQA